MDCNTLLKKNVSLKNYNTFGVNVNAKQMYEIQNIKDLQSLFEEGIISNPFLVLGDGSNILFTKDFDGTIIKINLHGKEILEDTDKYIKLKISAGEKLEEIVKWTVENNLIGIQNLALIPGTIGATPIQNVGAYGVEIKDVLESVEFFDLKNGIVKTISGLDCEFGYRDSIFKHELKGLAIVTSITIKLEKYKQQELPERYLAYGDITKELESQYSKPYTLENLYQSICNIRKSKLPDVKEYGSCGSTFQNPIVSLEQYIEIKKKYESIPSFPTSERNFVKIPAAYILEKLGWKNRRVGKCGTWTHPLIVTNYDNASPKDILDVIEQIQKDFYDNIGVRLETEINII
ncbi:TPA: UDP-N-acetylenolpyruvoylglucosamine reductase [Patescibacteria group bacterium]|nr:UDP-N-acetylenolpyruvoylglucosamine reductase [Patescibacteria group bacterium]